MTASSELFRHLADRKAQLRLQRVQNAALADAGVSGEGRELARDARAQRSDPLAGLGAGTQHVKACVLIDPPQGLAGTQIVLVDAQQHRNILTPGNGKDAVDQERLCLRDGAGRQHDQKVYVGNGRPEEGIAARQNLVDRALAVRLARDPHEITNQRREPLLPKAAACAALHNAVRCLHIIKAAECFYDPVLLHQYPSKSKSISCLSYSTPSR